MKNGEDLAPIGKFQEGEAVFHLTSKKFSSELSGGLYQKVNKQL